MEQKYLKQLAIGMILVGLLILSYFVLKPFLMAALFGIFLAFIFAPVYTKLNKRIKSKNLSSTIVVIILAIIVIVPLWFLTPILVKESINIFMASQQIDLVTPLKNIFPSLFASEQFSSEIGSVLYSFINKITNSAMNMLSNLILNFPTLFLEFLVAIFTFFFVLRDGDKFVKYIQSLMPFSKDVEKKIFKSSRDITFSVLYGQVVLGILQGAIVGIAFFAFGVENALFLTLLAAIAGIFPIIGTAIVWIPVAVYLLVVGDAWPALGVIIFGAMSSILETIIKPLFVSHRTKVHSAIILLGMVGGLFIFGFLGIVIGPLILSYLLIVLEIYRDKKIPSALIEEPDSKEKK